MSKKNTAIKSLSTNLGGTLSTPKNVREKDIKHAVESEWSIQILKGTLNGHSQFVVSIQSHAEFVSTYYKYADIMGTNPSKTKNIEIDLMNRGGLARGGFIQIQSYIERLRKEHAYIERGDISGLFSTENTQEYADVAILEREAEMYFNLLLEYIDENIELFPVRNLETDIDSKEGYQDGVSQGVYIADAKGKKYGCESIAIIPQYLRDVLDISSTKTLGAIFDCWRDKGYLYFDTSSVNKRKDMLVKFQKGMSPKRAYVLTIANSKKELNGIFELNNIKSLATIGGKARLLKLLIPILRASIEHHGTHTFLDIFGGGNKVIPPLDDYVQEAIYNDIDRGFCNVMACCTEMDLLQDMIDTAHQYQYLIQTKEDFRDACDIRVDPSTPMVISAALTIIVQKFSRAADRKSFSKANANSGISYKSLLRVKELYASMSKATVICTEYEKVLEVYKHQPDAFIYLDPPYFETNSYSENIDHQELADSIVNATAYIILSNFDNLIYEKTLVENGWNKYSLGVITKSSSGKKGSTQPEFIWSNFDIPEYLLPSIEIDASTK